jgi:hypothetical protein
MSSPAPPSSNPTADFEYEVGGVTVITSFALESLQTILAWSTSEVIQHLGSEGPTLQAGLRKLFGE